jgi:hypothetical protein
MQIHINQQNLELKKRTEKQLVGKIRPNPYVRSDLLEVNFLQKYDVVHLSCLILPARVHLQSVGPRVDAIVCVCQETDPHSRQTG